ncbi:MAG: polysaccharide deacetylase family protein [Dehalococcoidia bacterium]|nr:polysaccharide deacetylase family protein [Dehalococcoidia bacterium]
MEPGRGGPFPYSPITERPRLTWPDGARVALWVVPNIEVFSLEEKVPIAAGGSGRAPDIPQWSVRDYGARVGVWRLMDALTEVGIRGTVALNSEVCDVYPPIIEAALKLGWEFMGHNESNTRRLNEIPPEDERRVIGNVAVRIEKAAGKRPAGWLGAGLQETWNTLDHLVAEGYRYVADWVNDDQPYVMRVGGKPLVSVPYSYEINDKPAFESQHRTPEEFDAMIRRQFDVLYREGASSGRVMAICLHPYIIGVPYRIDALRSALAYICGHQGVWRTTGAEIADHYLSWSRTAGQPR